MEPEFRIAILDDYQNAALSMTDWSAIERRASITVFNDHLADTAQVVARLTPFDIVCVMRERTPLSQEIIEQLPRLKLIASTGHINAAIDVKTAAVRGVKIVHTGYASAPTIELTWALILSSSRHIVSENASLRNGGWQRHVGDDLRDKTLGILGLGNIGSEVARIATAFGMNVIAWSENLTVEKAAAAGAALVSKQALFERADIVSIHLILSRRTRGLIGSPELALMKSTAWLINTSRGPIVAEEALITALADRKIAGTAVDVFDTEPLPQDHPFRKMDNVLATPHIGYVSKGLYQRFYQDTVANVGLWLDEQEASSGYF